MRDHGAMHSLIRTAFEAGLSSATPPSPSTGPEGCAWLPLEPTEAMVHAAEDLPAPRMFGKVWRAMAGAALASRPAEPSLKPMHERELAESSPYCGGRRRTAAAASARKASVG